MIIVGDLHLKEQEIYKKSTLLFLKWLSDNYKDETIIQLGDFFDSSSINHRIMEEVVDILKTFKNFHIIAGNHDQSKRLNNILKILNLHDNITVYETDTEVSIEGHKCLMLPFQFNCKYYEELTGEYDFIFTHTTPKEESWGGEFIDLSKLKGTKIYGHIHTKANYPDMIIVGVPKITRNLEKNNNILNIQLDKKIKEIEVPVFFNIQDLEYGEPLPNKDWLYNIKNAPSVKSVYETYPRINIRDSGISILYQMNESEDITFNRADDLSSLFKDFCAEKEIEEYILKEGITTFSQLLGN